MKKSISVILSAHQEQYFIEECLDSINNQTYFKDYDDYEILLGIDGCEETKNKVLEIKDKYKNLRVFWFEDNNGPYLVFNTLISKSKYDVISIFGADDTMFDDFIEYNIKFLNDNNFIRTRCTNYRHPNRNDVIVDYNTDGIILVFKEKVLNINGYRNWRCGGDTDLRKRLFLMGYKIINTPKVKFWRRIHDKSLTNSGEYVIGSPYRKNIQSIIDNNTNQFIDKFEIYEKVKEI